MNSEDLTELPGRAINYLDGEERNGVVAHGDAWAAAL
jgi:hypothetical protein